MVRELCREEHKKFTSSLRSWKSNRGICMTATIREFSKRYMSVSLLKKLWLASKFERLSDLIEE